MKIGCSSSRLSYVVAVGRGGEGEGVITILFENKRVIVLKNNSYGSLKKIKFPEATWSPSTSKNSDFHKTCMGVIYLRNVLIVV